MKLLFKYILLLAVALLVASCQKNDDDGNDNPIDIDRPLSGEATIIGIVYDLTGQPMPGVNVTCGNATGITNEKGRFQLDDAPEGKGIIVDFEIDGFAKNQEVLETVKNSERLVFATMIPIGKTTTVPSTGGKATHNGMEVDFPAGSFVNADGSAFTGDADVEITFVPPTTDRFTEIFPGNFEGIGEDGTISAIQSYGYADINISANGNELKLAEGIQAKLTYPIAQEQMGNAPTTIPLWYYDFERGAWIEEGAATRVGNNYVGEVSHFTPWNCDKRIPVSTLTGRVVDGEGNPLSNALVTCISQGDIGWLFSTYSDEQGRFSTPVEASVEIKAQAYYSSVSSDAKIHTTAAAAGTNDLGDLVIDTSDLLTGWEDSDLPKNKNYGDIFFLDCDNGWISTATTVNNDPAIEVYRTIDGGETWTSTSVMGQWKYENNNSKIYFADKNVGVLSSMFGHFYTTDGGNTWSNLDPDLKANAYMVDNAIITTDGEVTLLGQGNISRTSDYGATWTNEGLDVIDNEVFMKKSHIIMSEVLSPDEYYLVTGTGSNSQLTDFDILHTKDNGATWSHKEITGTPFSLSPYSRWIDTTSANAVFTLNSNNVYIADRDGFYHSTDLWSSWNTSPASITTMPSSLFMYDDQIGWIGTFTGGILGTTDGGNTWKPYLTTTGNTISNIYFCSPNNGWAISSDGVLRFKPKTWL